MSDPRAEALLHPMDADQRLASMHVVKPDGSVVSRGRAGAEALACLPLLGWLPAAVDRYRSLSWFAEAAYRIVADNRHRLARVVRDVSPVSRWRGDP